MTIYRVYDHAKGATVFSVMTALISSVCILCGSLLAIFLVVWRLLPQSELALFKAEFDSKWVTVDIVLVVAGILCALASKYLSRFLARKIIDRKMKRSVNFCYKYTLENPYEFRYAASLNRDFSHKYYLDRDNVVREKLAPKRRVPKNERNRRGR